MALGGEQNKLVFFSLDHAEEVHRESQEINDSAWDCTLISKAKEHADLTVSAIYEWSDEDVWDFIRDRNIEVNPLYEMGFRRVGCVLCPLTTNETKLKEIAMFPTYKQAYINAFQQLIDNHTFKRNDRNWKTGEEVFNWWIEADKNQVAGQMELDLGDST